MGLELSRSRGPTSPPLNIRKSLPGGHRICLRVYKPFWGLFSSTVIRHACRASTIAKMMVPCSSYNSNGSIRTVWISHQLKVLNVEELRGFYISVLQSLSNCC